MLLLTLLAPSLALAQDAVHIEAPPVCEACELSVRSLVTIHDEDGEAGLAGHPMAVARAPNGRVFLASSQFEPMWFEANGAFGGLLGGRGEGPGEFQGVGWVGVDGDEVVTWDTSLNRRSVWTLEGEFVSSSPLPSGAPLVRPAEFPDGSAVVSVALDQPASAGLPYHHFDEQGEWVRSFGTEVVVREPRDRQALSRLVAPAGEASFWASPRFEYALEHYTKGGEHLATITRSADWFSGPSGPVRVAPEVPPNPSVRALSVDGEGLVWVLLTVPNPQWHEGFEETAGDPGFRLADYHQVFDSVVEVIDPASGTLVASRRFDAYFMAFAGTGHLAGFNVDEFGVPIIEIFEIELHRP